MKNDTSKMTEQEIYNEYIELISKGLSDDSPEMMAFFENSIKRRAKANPNHSYSGTKSDFSVSSQNITQPRVRTKSSHNQQNYQSQTTQRSNHQDTQQVNQQNIPHPSAQRATQQYSTNSQTSPRTRQKKNSEYTNSQTTQKTRQNSTSEYDYSSHSAQNFEYDSKFHIIVNPYKGDYTLLDKDLNIVDTMHKNYLLHMFTRKFSLNKFKRELKRDYKLYKNDCRKKHIPIDKNFKYINHKIKDYLKLCPDADYQILELLRRNVQKIDSSYSNYQTACAQYLHELAVDIPYPERLPFDLNYVCTGNITNSHKHIAHPISYCENPIENFRAQLRTGEYRNSYLSNQHIEVVPPKKKLVAAKHVQAPKAINQDYSSR